MEVPAGYILVPEFLYEKFIKNLEWVDVKDPTIQDVERYLSISSSKIRMDLNNINCPLKESYEGGRGKGNQKRFIKKTVELYKDWLVKK